MDRSTIWKRRLVLMAVVALVVAIPLTIALRGGGEDAPAPSAEPQLEAPELGGVEFNRKVDAELRLPEGWTQKQRGDVLILQSGDKQARIAISSPGPARDADQLSKEVVAGFEKSFEEFEVTDRSQGSNIGGLKAKTIAARGVEKASSEEVGVVISTAEGDKRAYLVVAFTPLDPGDSAVEAQAILNEMELVG